MFTIQSPQILNVLHVKLLFRIIAAPPSNGKILYVTGYSRLFPISWVDVGFMPDWSNCLRETNTGKYMHITHSLNNRRGQKSGSAESCPALCTCELEMTSTLKKLIDENRDSFTSDRSLICLMPVYNYSATIAFAMQLLLWKLEAVSEDCLQLMVCIWYSSMASTR